MAYPSLRVSTRATRTLCVALLVGAIALLSVGTRPAETLQTSARPLYMVKDLGTLGGSYSYATGINDSGKVVGYSATSPGVEHAFLYDSANGMKDLGTLGGYASNAADINNNDKVVGFSTPGEPEHGGPFRLPYWPDPQRAFLYSDGVMWNLNSLIPGTSGWKLNAAYAINDKDYIVGGGQRRDGAVHAFLLIPTQRGQGSG